MKKVAVICNMNQIGFVLARLLRAKGYHADLFLTKEYEHFMPHNDSYSLEYQSYTYELGWGEHNLHDFTPEDIRNQLKGYDRLVGCGVAPAFVDKADLKLDVIVAYGGDLYQYPFIYENYSTKQKLFGSLKLIFLGNKWMSRVREFCSHQLQGIKKSGHIMLGDYLYTPTMEKLGVEDKWVKIHPPIVDTEEFNPTEILSFKDRSHWFFQFQEMRLENELLILSHCRQHWTVSTDTPKGHYSNRGNDRFLRAFARLVKDNPDRKIKLAIVEYGPDVPASKQLLIDLGVNHCVQWMPKMARKDVMQAISMVDFTVDVFRLSGMGNGTIFETISMGKPILRYRDDQKHLAAQDYYSDLYPLMNASTEEEIYDLMSEYLQNPEKFKEIGRKAREWYMHNINGKALDLLCDFIEEDQ